MPFVFSRKNVGPVHSLTTQGGICESHKQRVITSNTWGRQTAAAKLLHLTLGPRSNHCGGRKARGKNNSCGRWRHGEMKPSTASSLHLPCSNAEGGSRWMSQRSPQASQPSASPTATLTPGTEPAAGPGRDVGASSPYLGRFSASVPQEHRYLMTEVRNTGKAVTQHTCAPKRHTADGAGH